MKLNHFLNRLRNLAIATLALTIGSTVVGCNEDPIMTQTGDIVDGVYITSSKPFGKSYAEWSAEWWKWAFENPASDSSGNTIHPLLDTTGQFAGNGQSTSGSVYFLGGSLLPGTYTRTVTIPAGKAIFFPVINKWTDTTGNWNIDSMRTSLDRFATQVTEASAGIDGRAVSNLTSYRFRTTEFSVTLPDHNLYQMMGAPLAKGTVMPILAEGYWVMLAPLSKGTHTIHFKGKHGTFELDMTYNITVQ